MSTRARRRKNGELAQLLRDARKAKELSLSELAEMTGLSRSYLGDLETGRKGYNLPMATVAMLAQSLDLSPAKITSKMDIHLDIDTRQYGEHYKVLRSSVRAGRVAQLLQTISADCKAAQQAVIAGQDVMKLLQAIEKTVKAVDNTLAYRGKPPVGVRPMADSLDDEKFHDYNLSKSG